MQQKIWHKIHYCALYEKSSIKRVLKLIHDLLMRDYLVYQNQVPVEVDSQEQISADGDGNHRPARGTVDLLALETAGLLRFLRRFEPGVEAVLARLALRTFRLSRTVTPSTS